MTDSRRIALTAPAFAIIDSLSEAMDVSPAIIASALIDSGSRSIPIEQAVDAYLKRYPTRNVSRAVSRLAWERIDGGLAEFTPGAQIPPGIYQYKEYTLHRPNGHWVLNGPGLEPGRSLGIRRDQAMREANEIILSAEGV